MSLARLKLEMQLLRGKSMFEMFSKHSATKMLCVNLTYFVWLATCHVAFSTTLLTWMPEDARYIYKSIVEPAF